MESAVTPRAGTKFVSNVLPRAIADLFRPAQSAAVVLVLAGAMIHGNALASPQNLPVAAAAAVRDAAGGPPIERSSGGPWAKGRILVQANPGLPDAEFDTILRGHGARKGRKIDGLDVHVIELPAHAHGAEHAIAQALKHNPHVKFAEVDEIFTIDPAAITNDPVLAKEWHIAKIGATTAWDLASGAGIVVAVLDTGVQTTHPDLAANIVPGWNAYGNNSNAEDVNGHGTAVAGAVAAVGNNALGVVGVAYRAKIMPIRITDSSGATSFSIMANGLTWAADHGADVANISFSNVFKSTTMQSAAQYLRNKGGQVVVSANNNGKDEQTANTGTMITVSATNQNDALASFSSWGAMVDVAAPGDTIQTTLWKSGYGWGSGTSFATPVTSGVVALIMSANPALTPAQIENVLFTRATDLGTSGYDIKFGYGRVNAAAAVQAAKAIVVDTIAPSVGIASPTSGTVSGIVPVSVNATDNVGVTKTELYAGGTLVATDTVKPYSFSWDTTKKPNGTYGLQAKAYDASGRVASSPFVNVTVSNATSSTSLTTDTVAPSVAISNPKGGTKVKGNISIQAAASDNVAVTSLSLYVDGAMVATGNAASLLYNWNANKAKAGSHTIQAVAKDAAGNTKTVSVSVTK